MFTLALLALAFGGGAGAGAGSLLASFSSPRSDFVQKPVPAATRLHADDKGSDETLAPATQNDQDRLVGGLLSPAFDEQSCRSRYASSSYRRSSPFRPSPYLVDRLKRYEARHRRCGPGAPLFKEAVEDLRSGRNAAHAECQYVVWTPLNGLGNRMLSLASTFLYALLTDRVLLVHEPPEYEGLFCEPFPGSSWTLPAGFPITDFAGIFTMMSPTSYKNMRQAGAISSDHRNVSAERLPAFVFLDLIQSFTDAAFCDADQRVLAKFNWMVLKSDVYFVPMLFLMPAYERELVRLFPEKGAVFHLVARYLFHPSNDVWGIVCRLYEAYLARADERIGLQVRVFPEVPVPFGNMYGQIVRCSDQHGLLPKVVQEDVAGGNHSSAVAPGSRKKKKLTSILVTSLFSDYYERIRGVYLVNPTATGEHVEVHQPSHDKEQHTEARAHNQRALAEIYLLSFCNRMVTTAVSTFGYVAHGLAGVRPWVLLRPPSPEVTADPACVRSETAEPCLQAPPRRLCGVAEGSDLGTLAPSGRGVLVPVGPVRRTDPLGQRLQKPVVLVMGRPGDSHGSGGVAGDEERQPLRCGGLETERSPAPFVHHGVQQQEARRGSRLWRASVRAGLVLCLLTIPGVLFLMQWQANSSPRWVFEVAEPPAEDDEQVATETASFVVMWRAGVADEEQLPLKQQGQETKRAAGPSAAAEAKKPRKLWTAAVRAALLVCFLAVPAVLLLQRWQAGASPEWVFDFEPPVEDDREIQDDMPDDLSPSPHIEYDKLLGGLLIEGFDEKSCLSRYQFARYHKNSTRIPSPYLLERLRKQEALQKRCGPGTKLYKKAAEQLRSGQLINVTECNYLFLTIHAGLGNRMLEITSAFLYALITNRVLLVDRYKEIADLFCEPFPETSWLVPSDFPLNYGEFTQSSPESYGNMVQNKVFGGSTDRSLAGTRPPYVYLHLDGDYGFHDKLFYCQDDQQFLQGVPWLIMRTDMYFVPSLFLIPAYQEELSRLFPEKDTVFHHLGRYLFHPTNDIWYSVTKYYRSYLAKAEKIVGIQIRIYETKGILQRNGPFPHILNQILSCAQNEKLLPEISMTDEATTSAKNNRTIAVLTTSLSSWYSDQIQEKYDQHRTVDGTTVKVYQPSHEEYQRSRNKKHNMKALAEIYLLSMTDVLITSGFSTFGYAAQGLAGFKPWIMFRSENHVTPDPPCRRAMSIEPCFHQAPYYDCKAKRDADLGKVVPYVRHCEDVSWGLKIVNQTQL
ncbi:hypothetical protein EJB05_20160, partial [Eragrostis curvula]